MPTFAKHVKNAKKNYEIYAKICLKICILDKIWKNMQ